MSVHAQVPGYFLRLLSPGHSRDTPSSEQGPAALHSSPAAAFVESPLAGRVSGAGSEVNDHVTIAISCLDPSIGLDLASGRPKVRPCPPLTRRSCTSSQTWLLHGLMGCLYDMLL